jgi:hypothetical protein
MQSFLERLSKLGEDRRDWLALVLDGALYIALLNLVAPGRALAAALTVGIFYVMISREWYQRTSKKFWVAVAAFAVIHLAALSILPFPDYHGPGLMLLPLALADGFAMYGVLRWVERRG